VTQPLIVLADEPTANLDSETGTRIIELMRKINDEDRTTFIFSTHDAHIMREARRIVRILDGRIIDALVAFGTFLVVFGSIFASSASRASRASIIDNSTGDFILYSERSKDLPSPFAFNSPLPRIRDLPSVEAALAASPEVEAWAPYAQNYGVIQVELDGKKVDLPFIFYAVEPDNYLKVFGTIDAKI
jgi:energy-coupling factor transporter ATP-binding protein EcfA2